MNEFLDELKIPKARLAVLIGEKGVTKREIENKLDVKLKIDSEEGDVEIIGQDSFNLLLADKIVKAIGRGFNPKHAMKLLNDNYTFEMIEVTEFVGKSTKQLLRVKSRIIGTGGKTRKAVEALTNTRIVIYGKTVSIIGDYVNVGVARRGLEMLLSGMTHASVYRWLEGQKKKLGEKDI